MEYKSSREKILSNMRAYGVKIWNVNMYFNNSIVQNNYGISSIQITDNPYSDVVVFNVVDEKKFLTKVIKYGI